MMLIQMTSFPAPTLGVSLLFYFHEGPTQGLKIQRGHNVPPRDEIGLTDLPNLGGTFQYFAEMPTARFSNPGGLAVMHWAYFAPLVVIGLTELPNSGWAKAHPAPPLAASLLSFSSLCRPFLVLIHKQCYHLPYLAAK